MYYNICGIHMLYVLLLRLPVELFHIGFMKLEEEKQKKKNISDNNINKINFTNL